MQLYECVIVFDVQMADTARESFMEELSGAITLSGGEVRETIPFGIRPLSMELKGRTRGDYRVIRFVIGLETLQRMDKLLRLKDTVLRFMITRYHPPKPKKEKVKKPKPDEQDQPETEGEASDGKSEQSTAHRESDPAA